MLYVKFINFWRWWGGGGYFLEVRNQYAKIFVILFSEIIVLSYKELDKNRDFSILFLIEIFLFFFNVKIIEKG